MQFGATFGSSLTSLTGIRVARDRISARWDAWDGERCETSTNAMPVSVGNALSSWVNASRPPAEAPTQTTGKGRAGWCCVSALRVSTSDWDGAPAAGGVRPLTCLRDGPIG